jgi:hypothetical protein
VNRLHVRTLPCLIAAVALSGCMSYIPMQPGELPVGEPVRIVLSRQAFADLPQISDRQGQRLEGTLVRRTDDQLVVHVPMYIGATLGQDLAIPQNGIVSSDLRVMSKGKTALVALGTFGVLAAAVIGSASGKEIVMNNPSEPDPGNEGFSGRGIMSSLARVFTFSIAVP